MGGEKQVDKYQYGEIGEAQGMIRSLFGAALCFREHRSGVKPFRPSRGLLNQVFRVLSSSLSVSAYYQYDSTKEVSPAAAVEKDLIVRFIVELHSFQSDIRMIKQIVAARFSNLVDEQRPAPESMELAHCLDQHSITDIAHFIDDHENPTMSLVDKMKLIWSTTGQNSRKTDFSPSRVVLLAQLHLWDAKTALPHRSRPVTRREEERTGEITLRRNLSLSWIAGAIGPVEFRLRGCSVLCFVNPANIAEFLVIRKPSRENAIDSLTPEMRQQGEELMRHKLTSSWTVVTQDMIGVAFEVQYRDGIFVCRHCSTSSGKRDAASDAEKEDEFDWVDFCAGKYTLSTFKLDEDDCSMQPHRARSTGIIENALQAVDALLSTLPREALSRLGMYLFQVTETIELHKLNREGKGVYKQTHWTDSYVFKFLQTMCIWLPRVISTDASLKFTVHHYTFWQEIVACVKRSLADSVSTVFWTRSVLCDERVVKKHQREALETLLDRNVESKRGHLIWMEPGQGKTLIVLTFLTILSEKMKMPKYCVYTLPCSAIKTIEAEIKMVGFPYRVHATIDRKKPFVLEPYTIHLIDHDKLRDVSASLLRIAPSMFLVVDEMHLCMDDTLRTSAALELASVSFDFIAMTGTLIKDKDENKVIQWLRMSSEFPITARNYMIGIASLISRKLDLGIEKIFTTIPVAMSLLQLQAYKLAVDEKFGGTAAQMDQKAALQVCYEVIYDAMLSRTCELLGSKRPLFVVTKDVAMQKQMHSDLEMRGIRCFSITSAGSINLPAHSDRNDLDVVITTVRHSAGYTLTKASHMITGVFYSNQATREQLLGRIHRVGQPAKQVIVETFHTGILSYTQRHYETAKHMADTLKDMVPVGDMISDGCA